jgi:hypothetical protein
VPAAETRCWSARGKPAAKRGKRAEERKGAHLDSLSPAVAPVTRAFFLENFFIKVTIGGGVFRVMTEKKTVKIESDAYGNLFQALRIVLLLSLFTVLLRLFTDPQEMTGA